MVGGVLNAAAPKSNNGQAAAEISTAAVKSQTAVMGHNTFRPDIYRVSEGYLA